MSLLKFSHGCNNSKLKKLEEVSGKKVYSFSTLSGWNCPGADECLAKVIVQANGRRKLIDGPNQRFRCFSASQEALFTNVYKQREHNDNLIKTCRVFTDVGFLISKSLPRDAELVRVNVAGDIQNQKIFDGWRFATTLRPDVTFYAYTKSLPFWVARKGEIPDNLRLVASVVGRYDNLISEHNLRFAKVVFSEQEAVDLGLEIDHDDSHAALGNTSFALLLHGQQQAGSEASAALSKLRNQHAIVD